METEIYYELLLWYVRLRKVRLGYKGYDMLC